MFCNNVAVLQLVYLFCEKMYFVLPLVGKVVRRGVKE